MKSLPDGILRNEMRTPYAETFSGGGIDSTNRLEIMLAVLMPIVTRSLHGRPYGLPEPDMAMAAFLENWSCCDDTWKHRNRLLDFLRRIRDMDPEAQVMSYESEDQPGRVCKLSELERPRWHAETAPITLYRGCSRARIKGISWTADKLTAAKFARGHRGMRVPDPVIAVATVPPAAIFTAPSGVQWDRNEDEFLIDPDLIEIIEILHWPAIADILGPENL